MLIHATYTSREEYNLHAIVIVIVSKGYKGICLYIHKSKLNNYVHDKLNYLYKNTYYVLIQN